MIERPHYIDRLRRLRGVNLVKVLCGMRRSGKSALLRLLERDLIEAGTDPAHIISCNLELVESEHLRSADALLAHIQERAPHQGVTYVLVDEAQVVPGIGRVVYALQEAGRFDIYLTGSHTSLVERELADVMAGRYVVVEVTALSFAEYAAAHGGAGPVPDALFQRYLRNGALPHALALEDDAYALREYLDGVYQTVVRKDVAASLGKEDPTLVDAICAHLLSHLGQGISANAVSKWLGRAHRSCSDDTVALYLRGLTDAYAFYRSPRLDLRLDVALKTQERYFAADLGLATLMVGSSASGLQGLLENVCYLELRRRFGRVFVGKHYSRQVSFVAEGEDGRAYFQVAPSVTDPAVLERTLAPLRGLRDNYPKYVLTLDAIGVPDHAGIAWRPLVPWLLDC